MYWGDHHCYRGSGATRPWTGRDETLHRAELQYNNIATQHELSEKFPRCDSIALHEEYDYIAKLRFSRIIG